MKSQDDQLDDPLKDIISVNRAVTHFWFATLTTLLHESRHQQQRMKTVFSYTAFAIIGLSSWAYDVYFSVVRNILHSLIIPALSMLLLIYVHLFFERDARRYERASLSDIVVVLAALEYSLIVLAIRAGRRTIRRNLSRFYKEMKTRTPDLVG
jgi:hypothetical protein